MTLRNMTGPRIAGLVLMLLITASCASVGGGDSKKAEHLKSAVDAFNQDFRWEDYKAAGAWVPVARKANFWAAVDKFKGKVRIFDYQLREVNLDEKAKAGTATISFQFYRTSSPMLETVTVSQKWYFSEKEKSWKLGKSGFQALIKDELDF